MIHILMLAALPLISANPCSSIHSSLWCSSANLSQNCGVKHLCDRYLDTTYNQRINITLLVEALCPYCQLLLRDLIYPVIYKNFGDFVNIQFVPYGNAKIIDGKIKCQHGELECKINKYQSCLIYSVVQQIVYVPMMYCLESKLMQRISFENATVLCYSEHSITQAVQEMIQNCINSGKGDELQMKAAEITKNVWPERHRGVPWVVINGVSLDSFQDQVDDLPRHLCDWYHGWFVIPYCAKQQTAHSMCLTK